MCGSAAGLAASLGACSGMHSASIINFDRKAPGKMAAYDEHRKKLLAEYEAGGVEQLLDVAASVLQHRDGENERLRGALLEIMKGEGRFSRLPIEHAENTIEDMKQLAREALGETKD